MLNSRGGLWGPAAPLDQDPADNTHSLPNVLPTDRTCCNSPELFSQSVWCFTCDTSILFEHFAKANTSAGEKFIIRAFVFIVSSCFWMRWMGLFWCHDWLVLSATRLTSARLAEIVAIATVGWLVDLLIGWLTRLQKLSSWSGGSSTFLYGCKVRQFLTFLSVSQWIMYIGRWYLWVKTLWCGSESKDPDLLDLNPLLYSVFWDLVEVCALLMAILVLLIFFYCLLFIKLGFPSVIW